MSGRMRRRTEDFMILALGALSFVMFIVSFIPSPQVADRVAAAFEMGQMVQRAFSVVLFYLAFQLKKRKRSAWCIAMALFVINFLRGVGELHSGARLAVMAMDLLFFAGFWAFRADFFCPSSGKSKKRALAFLMLAAVGTAANAGLSYHYMRMAAAPGGEPVSLADSLVSGVGMIFGMGGGMAADAGTQRAQLVIFWFSWLCILAAVLCAARPWLKAQADSRDIRHARTLLNVYGKNPCSYLALESDKTLYFGRREDGVIPYGIVGDTVVVNGDPVCAPENFGGLLAEFAEFCRRSAFNLFFLGLTDDYLAEYEKQGFGYVKAGEEARFHLADYEISGKKGAKMRMNINHAQKAGVTVKEYKILEKRDPEIEAQIQRVSDEWLSEKKSGLLTFTMGTLSLENPMDRRYFYAEDGGGRMVAFVVFVPFMGKRGYMADVTRHGDGAPGGVMETIIYEAFQAFKEEGVEYGSLGVAPLSGLDGQSSNPMEKLLNFVYNNLNACYGFRDLYRAKEKYSPTEWVPSYYAYFPKLPTPEMLYAVVKIQNPRAIGDSLKSLAKDGAESLRRSAEHKKGQGGNEKREKS